MEAAVQLAIGTVSNALGAWLYSEFRRMATSTRIMWLVIAALWVAVYASKQVVQEPRDHIANGGTHYLLNDVVHPPNPL